MRLEEVEPSTLKLVQIEIFVIIVLIEFEMTKNVYNNNRKIMFEQYAFGF